jgi:guanidinobutyrase / D-arginase
MYTALKLSIILGIATLSVSLASHEHEHDELGDLELDPYAGHGHSHGEQLPLGYVRYPWQSPQTHVTYPGDDEGLQHLRIRVVC